MCGFRSQDRRRGVWSPSSNLGVLACTEALHPTLAQRPFRPTRFRPFGFHKSGPASPPSAPCAVDVSRGPLSGAHHPPWVGLRDPRPKVQTPGASGTRRKSFLTVRPVPHIRLLDATRSDTRRRVRRPACKAWALRTLRVSGTGPSRTPHVSFPTTSRSPRTSVPHTRHRSPLESLFVYDLLDFSPNLYPVPSQPRSVRTGRTNVLGTF